MGTDHDIVEYINSITLTMHADISRQFEDALLGAFNAGLNPSGVVLQCEDTNVLMQQGDNVIRYRWTVNFSRCEPITAADREAVIERCVATGLYAMEGGQLVRLPS